MLRAGERRCELSARQLQLGVAQFDLEPFALQAQSRKILRCAAERSLGALQIPSRERNLAPDQRQRRREMQELGPGRALFEGFEVGLDALEVADLDPQIDGVVAESKLGALAPDGTRHRQASLVLLERFAQLSCLLQGGAQIQVAGAEQVIEPGPFGKQERLSLIVARDSGLPRAKGAQGAVAEQATVVARRELRTARERFGKVCLGLGAPTSVQGSHPERLLECRGLRLRVAQGERRASRLLGARVVAASDPGACQGSEQPRT
jgi:hypothetical protein